MEFIGKLHPLIVHLPIGLIIAGFALDLVFRKVESPLVVKLVRFLIGLAAFAAILSAIFGYLLSISSGYNTGLVSTHQWFGIAFSVIVSIFFLYRPRLSGKRALWFAWFAILSVLVATGHFGGSLTHGENYLTDSAPDFIKGFLTKDNPASFNRPLDSVVVFQDVVQPIIEQKCWYCHNDEKRNGRLNLQAQAGWQKGGKNGDLVVPNDIFKSHILQRIYLPLDDKKHMPPKGKEQLSSAEVAILEWWITNGGDYEAKLTNLESNDRIDKILEPYTGNASGVPELDLPDYDEQNLIDLQNLGIKILPMAKESNLLGVQFRGDSLISNGHLTALKSLDKNIVRIDFSFSGVTSDQLKILNGFQHLSYLSLANTAIDDAGVKHLSKLENLRILNLHSSNITEVSLPALQGMKGLQKVFLYNTKISAEELDKLTITNTYLKVAY